jgi:hypothetical protein
VAGAYSAAIPCTHREDRTTVVNRRSQVVENYLITPKVFDRELELSDLAVLVAVIVGAERGGWGILALPVAAAYPTIERIWLRERLGGDTVGITSDCQPGRHFTAKVNRIR